MNPLSALVNFFSEVAAAAAKTAHDVAGIRSSFAAQASAIQNQFDTAQVKQQAAEQDAISTYQAQLALDEKVQQLKAIAIAVLAIILVLVLLNTISKKAA